MNQNNGISHGFDGTPAVRMTLSAFAAVALYNVIELIVIIRVTFKRYSGLYFWSFAVATAGIFPYILGIMFKFFIDVPEVLSVTMSIVGWCCMVTGQSVVLYSRLHLVCWNPRTMQLALSMIIIDSILFHVPTFVLVYGANSSKPEAFITPYSIWEKIQLTAFFIQELILSSIYITSITETLKHRKHIENSYGAGRKALMHLIYINILVVLLDITILGTEYAGYYQIQTIYKGAVYSVKLKLEFRILNQLARITRAGQLRDTPMPPRLCGTCQGKELDNSYALWEQSSQSNNGVELEVERAVSSMNLQGSQLLKPEKAALRETVINVDRQSWH